MAFAVQSAQLDKISGYIHHRVEKPFSRMAQKPKKSVSKLTHVKMFGKDRTATQTTAHPESAPAPRPTKAKRPQQNPDPQAERPAFLNNIHQPEDLQPDTNLQEFKPKENRVLDFGYLGSSTAKSNPNSFSSIFNKDHSEQAGVQRVFRKSMAFLIGHGLLFAGVVLAGINFFQLNILISLILIVGFTVVTNIFYIVLADKSYIWLSLTIQALVLLLFNSFIGQSFSVQTWLFLMVTLLLSYIAYTEVEKFQLGARLFKISIVTSEATRLLINLTSIIIALGVFNGIVATGSQEFIDETVLKDQTITPIAQTGIGGLGFNSIFINEDRFFQSAPAGVEFYDFLEENYRDGEILALGTDQNSIAECVDGDPATQPICVEKVQQLRYDRAQEWANERYPNITFPVQTELTPERYDAVIHEHYSQIVADFISQDDDSTSRDIPIPFLNSVPIFRELVIPGIAAISVYALLFVIAFVLKWVVYLTTIAIWKILEMTQFVHIDVENVEAEVVSI